MARLKSRPSERCRRVGEREADSSRLKAFGMTREQGLLLVGWSGEAVMRTGMLRLAQHDKG